MDPENKELKQQQDQVKEQKDMISQEEIEKERAMYEEQQKKIREEIEAESPLIGEIFQLAMLMDEFMDNEGFYIKLQNLVNIYDKYRKTRRDGSCFYRALAYSVFERIVVDHDTKLKQHMVNKIKKSKEHLLQANFEGLIFEDIQELLIEKLTTKLPKNLEEILALFRDPEESNLIVMMLRFITSGEIKNNAIMYETFIDDQIPVEMFCQIEVEPIDKEADQITIMALLNYLEIAIKIVYLDSSKNKEAYTVILPESANEKDVKATMLYRPGHYDILYK